MFKCYVLGKLAHRTSKLVFLLFLYWNAFDPSSLLWGFVFGLIVCLGNFKSCVTKTLHWMPFNQHLINCQVLNRKQRIIPERGVDVLCIIFITCPQVGINRYCGHFGSFSTPSACVQSSQHRVSTFDTIVLLQLSDYGFQVMGDQKWFPMWRIRHILFCTVVAICDRIKIPRLWILNYYFSDDKVLKDDVNTWFVSCLSAAFVKWCIWLEWKFTDVSIRDCVIS